MPTSDWRFARRPYWLLSHVFALAVVVSFLALGAWQLSRLEQRREANDLVAERSSRAALSVASALAEAPPDGLDYVAVADRGTFVAEEQVVVRNRSQRGAAGSWIITPLRTASGPTVLVNRGFVPDVTVEPTDVPVPAGTVEVSGYLRRTQERGSFGPTDPAEGRLRSLARVDVDRIDQQVPDDLAPVWLQLAQQEPAPERGLPAPVPLPELEEGNHLSYAVQWLIFAVLGIVVYGLLLRRRAVEEARPDRARAPAIG